MLKVSWDVSIQGCQWQPLSIHQSRYMYLLRVVTGQFKYQPLFCLEAEIVRLRFLMTFAGQEFFKHQKCQKKWESTHIKSEKKKGEEKETLLQHLCSDHESIGVQHFGDHLRSGIICGTVQHYFFNISSRKRDSHFYTCSSESRINRAFTMSSTSVFETLSTGTVPKIELARPPVLTVKRSTDWASLPGFREFTVRIIYPRGVPFVIW